MHDKMTLDSHLNGPLNAIHGEGKLKMTELHIPGLYFQGVNGSISYDGEKLDFKDVTANVYGGSCRRKEAMISIPAIIRFMR